MAKKSARYSPELRAEVVKAVREGGRTYAEAARDFGLVAETVRNWVIADVCILAWVTGHRRKYSTNGL
ncbi:transposase [Amycolatopsis minnesotensis]|uniref:Transposase n=1 Tax=Amycolatopsis minnesotensis TaxID=337894 RepID=A0ABN2RNM5_9PSEU